MPLVSGFKAQRRKRKGRKPKMRKNSSNAFYTLTLSRTKKRLSPLIDRTYTKSCRKTYTRRVPFFRVFRDNKLSGKIVYVASSINHLTLNLTFKINTERTSYVNSAINAVHVITSNQ